MKREREEMKRKRCAERRESQDEISEGEVGSESTKGAIRKMRKKSWMK